MGYWIPAGAGRTIAGPPPHPLILNLQLHPLILNLLKDGQRRLERPDGTEWRPAILQQVQDERKG